MRRRTIFIIVGISVAVTAIVLYLLVWNFIQISTGYIGIVNLEGTIGYGRSTLFSNVINPDDVKYYINVLTADPAAKAVVIIVNSPGGSAAASEEIYWYIKKLAERKPVVVYSPETLASGGYYISLPANRIIVSPYTLVGSVGAVSIVFDIEELLHNIGVNVTVIKSGEYKDIGSMYRPITDHEYRILSEIINKSAELFMRRVRENRPSVADDVFTARVYLGIDSVEVGLTDDIGTLEYAVEVARKIANLPPFTPTRTIEKPKSFLEALLGFKLNLFGNRLGEAIECTFPFELRDKVLFLWVG